MFRAPTLSLASLFVSALLFSPPSFAFESHLSSIAVRDAYFLGQRNDETTAYFLEKYRRHLPAPESGPWVSTVEVFTPFAQEVELSSRHTLNFSAQDAEEDYLKRQETFRVTVTITFTPSFGYLVEKNVKNAAASQKSYSFRSSDFWKNFSSRLFVGKTEIPPVHVQGHADYFYFGHGGARMIGASIVLTYDPDKISSPSDVSIIVDTPDGQHVVVPFDLNSLR